MYLANVFQVYTEITEMHKTQITGINKSFGFLEKLNLENSTIIRLEKFGKFLKEQSM